MAERRCGGAVEDWREPPAGRSRRTTSSARSPTARRRRAAAAQPALTILLVIVLVVAALAAAFWFFAPPEWKARLGLAAAGASPLALVTTHMDRQQLESGNELLTVTGRVINPTGKEQDVPPLQAQLRSRDRQGRLQLDDRAAGADPRRRGQARASTAPKSTFRRAATS